MKKRILQLAWPVMVSSLLNTTFITIDLFWLGRLGKIEIAAVSIAGGIMGIIYPIAMTVSSGTLALIARFKGNKDPVGIENTIVNSLLLSFILSLLLFIFLFPFSTQIISLFKPEHMLISYTSQYLRIMFIGLFFLIPYINTNAIYYAIGDTKTAMFIGIVVNIVNIILDPILIFGLLWTRQMGIKGAALASIISNLIGLIISVIILINRKVISISLIRRTQITFQWIKRILKIGIPSSLQGITRPLTGTLLYRIIAVYGTSAIAGFGIGVNILGWMFIYLNGFASASSILVGQHIGSGQHKMAESTVWHSTNLGMRIQVLFSIIFFIFASHIIRLFNSDPGVVRTGTSYLRFISPIILIVAANMMIRSAFQGSGDTKPPMISSLIANWGVKLGLAWLFSIIFKNNIIFIWIAIDLSVISEFIILFLYYRKKYWLTKKI